MLLAFTVLLSGCGPKKIKDIEGLSAFVKDEENRVTNRANSGDFTFTATVLPTDWLVVMEAGEEELASDTISKWRRRFDRFLYFQLSISRNGKEALHQLGDNAIYSELVNTLSFHMENYVNLTTADDTIAVHDYSLNRTYGLNESTDLIFSFERDKLRDQEWIQFNLNEFGLGVGNQRFRFRRSDLDAVPEISFRE
jgi:hypothetical protein